MKRSILILFVAMLTASLIFGGCPQPQKGPEPVTKPQESKVRYEVIQDQQSAFTGRTMPLPDWLLNALQGNLLQFGSDQEGKKVVYFVAIQREKNLESAKVNAKLNINARVAESVQTLVTSEAAKVFEGDQDVYAQYIQGAIGVLAKNVKVVGLVPVNEYWAELQEYLGDAPRDKYFSYAIRYQMDLSTWKQMLSGAWQETKKQQPNIPEKARQKMDNLINSLSEASQ
ncbi:MAG: hypothetical protein RMJ37_04990 [Spirochaetia bacterium]|nr:hypothetical protein [Spirochaetota bacterium]MCX8096519.1 hypothetical protein [Spirochaetota bacterium]MDW8112677.1 hypothetical protein [Spirochaetia bacterium]